MYSKAILMYAMALMGNDEKFEELQAELESNAVIEGKMSHSYFFCS